MTTDINGTPITEGATGVLTGDGTHLDVRIVDTSPEVVEDGYVLAELSDPSGAMKFYAPVMVPADNLVMNG